jgi:hypothetical protein
VDDILCEGFGGRSCSMSAIQLPEPSDCDGDLRYNGRMEVKSPRFVHIAGV